MRDPIAAQFSGPVNILHVISSLDPRSGGPMEGIRQLARAGRAWGQRTTVVTLDAPGASYLDNNPFTTVALGPSFSSYRYTPRLVPWLQAHARNFDAVIVNGLWQYGSFATWRALRGSAVPYFVFPHGMLDPYFKRAYPLKHLKKLLYWPWAEFRVLRDARAVLFTCEEERLLARQSFALYRCREWVAGLGTEAPPVDSTLGVTDFLASFPELRDKRRLLYLGRIHEKKGCDLLLAAFAELVQADPSWQLVLAGPCDKSLERKLRAQVAQSGIEARVTWTGMITGSVKWGALYSAEAFVLPSHQENFGIAVVEALSCGTPVLISNRVNIWREIESSGAGIVADDSLEGTRELLQTWVAMGAGAQENMRTRTKACFDAYFDIRQVARRLTDSIQSQIKEADTPARAVAA